MRVVRGIAWQTISHELRPGRPFPTKFRGHVIAVGYVPKDSFALPLSYRCNRRSEGGSNPRPEDLQITHMLRPAAGNPSRGGMSRPDMLLVRAFILRSVVEARGSNPLGTSGAPYQITLAIRPGRADSLRIGTAIWADMFLVWQMPLAARADSGSLLYPLSYGRIGAAGRIRTFDLGVTSDKPNTPARPRCLRGSGAFSAARRNSVRPLEIHARLRALGLVRPGGGDCPLPGA